MSNWAGKLGILQGCQMGKKRTVLRLSMGFILLISDFLAKILLISDLQEFSLFMILVLIMLPFGRMMKNS